MLKQKKILQINKYLYPDKGGIENISEQINLLSDNWKNFTNICFSNLNKSYKTRKDTKRFRAIRAFSQPISLGYFFYIIFNANKYDQIIVHFPNILAAIALYFSGFKKGLYIYWHSDIVQQNFILKIVARFFEKKVVNTSKKIIFATNTHMRYSYLDFNPQKCVTLPFTVLNEESANKTFKKRLRRSFNKNNINVLFIGRLVEYKGIEVLLEAFASMDFRINLEIVGTGPLRKTIKESIKNFNNISLHEKVSDHELEIFFEKADILVLPSVNKAEMFGVVQIEAFSRGIPVVSSNIKGSGVGVVNKPEVSGLHCIPGDKESLKSSLKKLIENIDMYPPKKIRKYYDDKFSNDKFNDTFLRIFR